MYSGNSSPLGSSCDLWGAAAGAGTPPDKTKHYFVNRKIVFWSDFNVERTSSYRELSSLSSTSLELVQVFQHHTGAQCHAVQRVFCHSNRDAGLPLHQLIQAAKQGAAAGEDNAVVDDVCRKLRRGLFQGALDGIHNRGQRIGQRLPDLLRVDVDVLGQAIGQVAALDGDGLLVVVGVGRTDLDLDLLSGALTDEQVGTSS